MNPFLFVTHTLLVVPPNDDEAQSKQAKAQKHKVSEVAKSAQGSKVDLAVPKVSYKGLIYSMMCVFLEIITHCI